jgi:hypothetical protein
MSAQNVAAYINDHLGGSVAALNLLDHLSSAAGPDGEFFAQLQREIESDQITLKGLLAAIDENESRIAKIAGSAAEFAGRIKTRWTIGTEQLLGTFESLEILVLGITGKLLLWRALGEVTHHYPVWNSVDFDDLARRAGDQRDSVERRRRELAKVVFEPADSGA